MTERYAFRYNEYLIQQLEKDKVFPVQDDLSPLSEDISARLTGFDFIKGTAPLEKLGIRVSKNDLKYKDCLDLTDTYGTDALRLVLLEGLPFSDENLTGAWRFIGNLWLYLKTQTQGDFKVLPYTVYDALKQKDFKGALLALKSFLKTDPLINTDLFCLCYPFMPHLVLYFVPDIHLKMKDFWEKIQKMDLPYFYFIEINGKKVMDFYSFEEQEEKITEEALSFLPIQNKIGKRKIKKIIIIPKKGVNFVV